MENFIIDNPTVLHFGKDVIKDLDKVCRKYGPDILLVYGKGSIKRNGIYESVVSQLKNSGKNIIEYEGIKPNPVIEDVDAAAELGRRHKISCIIAVGGGSVIDSAKIIAITIPVDHSGWDFFTGKSRPQVAIPVVSVLTLAATGTEMNPFAVVQNHTTGQKLGYGNRLIYPEHSFLDPTFTMSVPLNYTAYGIADLIAHALENYFGAGDASLSDRIVFGVIKEAIDYGPALLNDLGNYNLRARIMYAATCALNGLTSYGRVSGDWGVHSIGHIFSLLYDIPHGATLSVAYPAWLKHHAVLAREKISNFGKNVFNTPEVDETIQHLEDFFRLVMCPVSLNEVGIGREKFDEVIDAMRSNKVSGNHYRLDNSDYPVLLERMLKN